MSESETESQIPIPLDAEQAHDERVPVGQKFLEITNIYEHAPVGLGVLDRDLRWVRINRLLANRHGLTIDAHIGHRLYDILPDFANRMGPGLNQVLVTGVAELGIAIDDQITTRNGLENSWVEAWIPMRDESGDVIGINVVAEEVTPKRQIQKNLILRNQAIEAVSNGILIADASVENASDAPIVFANSAFTRITGFELSEVIGRDCRFLQDEQTDPQKVSEIRHALITGTECQVVLRNRRKDGTHFWNELCITPIPGASGRTNHFVAVIADITERILVEQRLRESETRYRTLFNSLDSGFCVFEMLYNDQGEPIDYVFLETNPEFAQHTGLHDAVGKSARMLVPELEQHWVDYYGEVADTGVSKVFVEESPTMGRWFEVHAFRFGAAELHQVALMFTDITEQKRYEASIEESRLAAEQAREAADASNRAKSEFLANMSHEIRTPLSAILGFAEILDSSLHNPDDLQAVETIRRNVDHLQSLLNDFLDLAKIEAGQFNVRSVPVELQCIIEEVVSLMHVRAVDAGLQLAVEYATPTPKSIVTDPVRLRQILINLLSNAIKFTHPSDGTTSDVCLRVSFTAVPGPSVIFEIIDTGIGLTREQQDLLFQPFSQIDNSDARRYEGTGLGLAISRRLANLLSGDISVSSERGKGSSFSLVLALDPDSTSPLMAEHELSVVPADNGDRIVKICAHILVVDDRPDIRVMLHHHLEKSGATVESFSGGESLLERLAATGSIQSVSAVEKVESKQVQYEKASAIDIILLDMQMPGLDGYETARRIRAAGCSIPIIALTASVLGGEREKCTEAGCSDYLSKPIRRYQLLRALSSHLQPDQFATEVFGEHADDLDGNGTFDGRVARTDTDREVERTSDNRCRVLVVEDHTASRQAMVRLLARNGYDVSGAGTADEARTLAISTVPNVIVLDRGLPDADGVSLAREFRSNPDLCETRLICVSGTAFETGADDEQIFDAYLLKPIELATLIKSILSLQ